MYNFNVIKMDALIIHKFISILLEVTRNWKINEILKVDIL